MVVLEEVDQGFLQTENIRQVLDMLDVLDLEGKIQHDFAIHTLIWETGIVSGIMWYSREGHFTGKHRKFANLVPHWHQEWWIHMLPVSALKEEECFYSKP